MISWLDGATLVLLLVVLPVLSIVQLRMLAEVQVERMPAYVSSIVSLLVLGGLAYLVGSRDGGRGALGLVPMAPTSFLFWTGALFGAGVLATLGFRWMGPALGLRETPILRVLLPRTGRERVAFAGLSVAAGLGEELAYRGYVIGTLAPLTGVVPAAALSTLVFGVLHVYQGVLGVARTTVLGGILAWGFLASGSLWPAVAAHVLLDLVMGIFVAERMMVPEQPSGVSSRLTSTSKEAHGSGSRTAG